MVTTSGVGWTWLHSDIHFGRNGVIAVVVDVVDVAAAVVDGVDANSNSHIHFRSHYYHHDAS